MKKITALFFVLLCITAICGCDSDNGDKAVITTAANTTAKPETSGVVTETVKIHGVVSSDPDAPLLDMETLRTLVDNRGEDLTWEDFSKYYSEDVGSGIHILYYPMEENYCLRIGGLMRGDKSSVMYMYLSHTDDLSNYIDIRYESVDDFLASDTING